jgi:drug/metabolite transporter (DMT)-like permease
MNAPGLRAGFAPGLAMAAGAVLLWGMQFPVATSAFRVVDALHVCAIRYGVAALLMTVFYVWREGRTAFDYQGRFWPIALIGLVGMCGSPVLVFLGLEVSTPEHAVVIIALQPSMTALADWLVRGRRPANFTLFCVVTAFAGVVIAVTRGDPAHLFSRGEMAGNFLVFTGALCWVVYTMASERFRGWSALRLTTLTLIPGTLGVIVATAIAVMLGKSSVPGLAAVSSVGWELLFLSLAGVFLGMIWWNAGAARIGSLNAMLLLNLVPVMTFAIRFAQGHRFAAAELVGGAMVIVALIANNLYLRLTHRGAGRPAA